MISPTRFPAGQAEFARQFTEQCHAAHLQVAAGELADGFVAGHSCGQFLGETSFRKGPNVGKFWNVKYFLRNNLHAELEFIEGACQVLLILESALFAQVGRRHLPFLSQYFQNQTRIF